MPDVREENINVVGNWPMPMLGDLNEQAITLEEVGEAVNEVKSPGLDGSLVSGCALVAHRYTYVPPCCRTSQYGRTFVLLAVSL